MVKKLFTATLLFFVSIGAFAQYIIKPNYPYINYEGRVNNSLDSTSIYWPGTSVQLNFKGTSNIKVKLKSTKEDAYFYVIIDDSIYAKIEVLKDQPAHFYNVASNLRTTKHHLTLTKLTNSTSANQFYGFELDKKAMILKPNKPLKRKIEFYGNSITAGHGVDTPAGLADSGEPKHFNNYFTYAAITARHFKAQYVNSSRSGIGVMVSWFPEIMPETFDRIDPLDSSSKWDFKNYQPDIIVVNLFQNDSWIINQPNHPQFKARFGTQKPDDDFIINAYKNLIISIRKNNPNSKIICALGNMDATRSGSKWPGLIKEATNQLNDSQIFNVFFPFKNTDGHPKRDEQAAMAKQLIAFIEKNMKW
jgi:hypothetical protein